MPRPQQRWSMVMIGASVVTYLAGLCLLIAFATPNWLEKNPRVPNKFIKMGLWEFCFNAFQHPSLQYHRVFTGCRWVFHRYYNILLDYLEPPWFIAVQVFMSLGLLTVTLSLALSVIIILNCCVSKVSRNLFILSILLWVSFVFNAFAVIIFGARGDDRDWLPSPQWNRFGWSFGFAVVGTILECLGASLFLVEWWRIRTNRPSYSNSYPGGPHGPQHGHHMGQQTAYGMQQRPSAPHSKV